MGTTNFDAVAADTFTGDVAASDVTTATITATGAIIFSGLPTSDPSVAGQLWSNSGVLTVSAGA